MADGDYYARNLAPKWRKVGNTLLGGQDADVVAGLAREAFSETMRRANGVPGLGQLCRAFIAAVRGGDRDGWMAANEEIRRTARHHPNTEVAAMAGQALLENEGNRLQRMDSGQLSELLAKETAARIAQHHFDRCRRGVLPDDLSAIRALRRREQEAIARMDVPGLASELLRHEDGSGFRAPARQVEPAGTAALVGRTLVPPS